MVNASLFVIALIALFLAWHPKYEDGLTGKLALGAIVVVCVVVLVGEWGGRTKYVLFPEVECLIFAFTWFFVRHCYRFVLWAYWGKHAWKAGRKPGDLESEPEHA